VIGEAVSADLDGERRSRNRGHLRGFQPRRRPCATITQNNADHPGDQSFWELQQVDVQSISLKLQNLYSPVMPSLPGYSGLQQIGQGGYSRMRPVARSSRRSSSDRTSQVTRYGSTYENRDAREKLPIPRSRAGAQLIGGVRFVPPMRPPHGERRSRRRRRMRD